MPADLPFFDTCYLVRLYLEDPGFQAVREVAATGRSVAAAWHARAEFVAALHRIFREHRMEQNAFLAALEQFRRDSEEELFHWLPLTDGIQNRLEEVFRRTPVSVFLRGADALHLACAAENGFKKVYSNDRHLLAAAPLFGLQGVNVIGLNQAA